MSVTLNFSKISCAGTPYEIGAITGELIVKNPELHRINIRDDETDVINLQNKLSL